MNKLVAFVLIFGFQLGNAQEIKEKALLWEISGNNLEKASYLFGTIHLACEGDVELRPEIQAAFDASENLILEMAMDDPALMTKMMQASISTDGKTISEKLGKDLAVKVDLLLLEKMGTGLNSFDQLNLPTFSAQMSLLSLDCPMALGYDMMLTLEAQRLKKEIVGLESIEKQIEILFAQSDEEAIQTIQYIVDNLDEFILETQQLMELYKQQNIQEMYNFTKRAFDDPKYPSGNIEKFLDERNQNWIPIIEKNIQSKPSFIAVGAAHLAGEQGVIQLLRNQGFTVTALTN